MLVQAEKVKTQCFMYAGAFFIVWTFPTIARLIQLLGGTMHPIIGVLAGTFIGSQGFFNAIIYFRPRYNMIERPGKLAKVWALVCVTLFFCCYDENCTRGTNYDNDYTKPQNSIRNSLKSRASANRIKAPDQEAAGEDHDIEIADADDEPEGGVSITVIQPKRTYFQLEPTLKMDEFIEDGTGDC